MVGENGLFETRWLVLTRQKIQGGWCSLMLCCSGRRRAALRAVVHLSSCWRKALPCLAPHPALTHRAAGGRQQESKLEGHDGGSVFAHTALAEPKTVVVADSPCGEHPRMVGMRTDAAFL